MMNIMNPPADWSTMKKLIWLRGTPITGGEELTVSGTPPLSLTNSLGKPLKAWSVDVLPNQEGTGDPAPDNVRPIHGTDKLTITTAGKNLFDSVTCLGGNGFVEQQDGSWYIANAGYIASGTVIWQMPIVYSGRMSIRLSYKNLKATGSQGGRFKWKYSDGTTAVIYLPTTADYTEFSNTSDANKNVVALTWDYGSSINSTWFKDIQLEFGSTVSDYTPYVAPSQTVIDVPPLSANKWDEQWELGYYQDDGTPAASANRIRSKNRIEVLPSTAYYVNAGGSSNYELYVLMYDANGALLQKQLIRNTTFTTPANVRLLLFYVVGLTAYNHGIAINYPSTVTTYNPYNATVYTGTIGSEGGESRWGEVDLGTLSWSYNSDALRFDCTNSRIIGAKSVPNSEVPNAYCTQYDVVKYNDNYGATGLDNIVFFDHTLLRVRDKRFTDATAFKTAMQGVKLVYELATPTTFSVPSPTIPTPTGTATTWATAEDGTVDGMEVTYVGKA